MNTPADTVAPPRAPLRAMQVLGELAQAPGGITLSKLCEVLGLPKTSVFSLLRSLEAGGYVVSDGGRLRLGQEAFNLAATIYQHDGLARRLRPVLQWVQQQSAETALLAVPSLDWSDLVFADVIESDSSLRFAARVGARRPLYSTSVGLALLAFAPPAHRQRYLAQTRLDALTPTTLIESGQLQAVTDRIRRDCYVVNSGSVLGATAVASPVFGATGSVIASIGFAGPTTRIAERSDFIRLTVEAGAKMSAMLGYRGAYPP